MLRWERGRLVLVCVIASGVLAAACQSSKASESGTPTTTRTVAARLGPTNASTTTTTPTSTITATATATAPNGATFSVRPTALTVGHDVTVSGTGCPSSDVVLAGINSGPGSGTGIEITAARADATWTASAPVADTTALGAVQAVATCALRSNHQTVFVYPTLPVHVATFRSVRVTPATTVRAGTTLTVSSTTPCPNPAIDYPSVTLSPLKPEMDDIDQNPRLHQSAKNWTATITVPAGSAPGTRTLSATCVYGRGYTAFYPDVTITVTP